MDVPPLIDWPLRSNAFVIFGALLVAGLLAGATAHRTGVVPRITGYLLVGLVLGPSGLGLLDERLLGHARVFVDVALGLILFQLGRQLDLRMLREDRSLQLGALLECVGAFALIFTALRLFDVEPLPAALAAAVGISSSPAVVFLVVRELGAKGPMTTRAFDLVAVDNAVAFFAYTLVLPFLHWNQDAAWTLALLQPVYQAVGSLALAFALAFATLAVARHVGDGANAHFGLIVATVVAAVGLAQMFNVSALLTVLALGAATRNFDRHERLLHADFGRGGDLFFVLLFVASGANLHLADLATSGVAALVFVVARFAGKTGGLLLATRLELRPVQPAVNLGLTLVPMAAMAIGLVQTTAQMYPELGARLSAIVLGAVAILETIGPAVTELALKRAGEVPQAARVRH